MKRLCTAFIFAAMLAAAASAEAALDRSAGGARARGMGGAFVSIADDGSALFLNPAGMVAMRGFGVYADYAEPPERDVLRETRLGLHLPARGTDVGVGWFRQGMSDETDLDRFVASAARVLASGTQGSLLAVGVGASFGRWSPRGGGGPAEDRSAESAVGIDAGIILRPLPVVSFGYSIGNASGARLRAAGADAWSRVQRWGVSYTWEEKVILSFEDEHGGGSRRLHCGVSVKTAVPIELMAGFSDGSASGGIRWAGSRVRAAVSFEAGAGSAVTWTGACEITLPWSPREGAK